MVLVAMCLGLRRSEISGLKWSDFNWVDRQVLIQRSVIANREGAVKTKKSKARLPLDPALIAVLEDWRANRGHAVLPERGAARLHHPGW